MKKVIRGESIVAMRPVQPAEGGSIPASPLHKDPRLSVREVFAKEAQAMVVERHYLHRKTNVSYAFGLFHDGVMVGVCTFGCPPSRHLQMGACPTDPSLVIELNRLWISDEMGRNTESWFISRALKMLPPRIVVSYADTSFGHIGYMYRACNFHYAGWTDMERKTPRYDYIAPGKHTRDAFRNGDGAQSVKVRRKPKHKYWTTTGNRRERKALAKLCGWPLLSWKPHEVASQLSSVRFAARTPRRIAILDALSRSLASDHKCRRMSDENVDGDLHRV